MNKQEFYREKYRQKNKGWEDSQSVYRQIIDGFLMKGSKILDIGCGHNEYMKNVYAKTNETYGIDPDQRALDKNSFIKNKFPGKAEKLPFQDNFFDLVVSAWTLEHIEDPEKVFKEIYRVLKPSGKVMFLTPNSWNYNVWIIRLIPERFHDFFTKRLYNRQENDTFSKFYRINSVRTINRTLSNIGFKKRDLILNGDPSYISFNEILFRFACFLEFLMDKFFKKSKVHLIGVYEKHVIA
ncbi:hypothetical protein A2483_04950 [Candidatus Peregrinibacteria bacterium RIFOXYC2_FULL_33_13]|nr:MAG: Methylase involved in ubiquinone/menaquinone biosynthesis [Candidatus Peregrinibacteria bacterium GW2011_GWA2_33_10]KKP41074.1 MAG: type 11 methyltransferase [Candidatus Peregrinibacteria bacterium GW2011_GWC2_33_13]OGJ54260.1 MAG: hypothetical protein A2483_04950 [Candidatus Peregrinibacteria bacterium RIFOXYC2_FULL_33_13]